MKKSVLILLALVVIATTLFVPVTAKDTGTNPDPVCNICTKLDTLVSGMSSNTNQIVAAISSLEDAVEDLQGDVTSILTALGLLQTDVAEIKTDLGTAQTDIAAIKDDVAEIKTDLAACNSGGTSDYTVYSLSDIAGDEIYISLWAPGITEDVTVEVKDWAEVWAETGITWSNSRSCGILGQVTLTPLNQEVQCHLETPDEYLIQIKVPESARDKIIFQVYDGTRTYLPGDFKVDPAYTS